MPVIKKDSYEIAMALLKGNIKKRMEAYQITDKQMGMYTDMNPDTFKQKKNHPERFTLPELITVCNKLHFPDSEILESIKLQ